LQNRWYSPSVFRHRLSLSRLCRDALSQKYVACIVEMG
jgi:hypothetical protein